ncbi:MAG: carboxypeptidase-like regulatory domain-containing protein [Bryobacteraceae bacterium]
MYDEILRYSHGILSSRSSTGVKAVIWLAMANTLCHGQLTTTGIINGTIVDQSGSAVAGAKVSITNVETRTVTQTASNSTGSFSAVGLTSGHYDVTVTGQGFSSFKEAGIYLESASVYTVHVALQLGTVTSTVTVAASAAAVQTTTNEISSTVSGEEVEALPLNGRNYQGIGSLMPGVINTSPQSAMGTGGYNTVNSLNVNGGGPTGSFYTLDGIWNNNTGNNNQTTILPNPDEIDEVKVLQSNYDSKYSLMGASVVIVQTKSGTGQFHGGGWEFLRNTVLDTRNFFSTTISPEEWNIFGWNLGGPIFIPHYYNTISAGVRLFYMPFPHAQQGYMVDFDPAKFNPANAPIVSPAGIITPTPAYDPANGIILNGVNGVPLNLTDAHKFYFAPTFGFAWDMFGNGRAALRGGYGVTYNRNAGMGAACSQGCVSYPVVQSTSLINANFPNPVGSAAAPLTANSVSGQVLDYQIGRIQTFSVSWQEQFGANWFVSIAGAGNVARHLQTSININQPLPFGGFDFNPNLNTSAYTSAYYAPYQGLGPITFSEPIGLDNWNALELGLRHPVGNNVYLTVAYTWSHNLDNAGGFQNVHQPQLAYGNSSLNVPQVFSTSVIYSVPWYQKSGGWKHALLGGWKYSDVTTIQSGPSQTLGLSLANTGLAIRPDLIAPVTYPKTLQQWFSTSSFGKPAAGYYGNVQNATIRGPALILFNMAAYKDFRIHERMTLQFRSEFFNVFNHTNFNGPSTNLGAGTFGQITSAKDPRTGELALKLRF